MTSVQKQAAVAVAAAVALAGVGTGVWAAAQTGRAGDINASRAAYHQPTSTASGCGGCGPSDWGMTGDRDGQGDRTGPSMMGGHVCGLTGNGQPVTSIPQAKARAQDFADRLDLRVGEIMQFSRNFYAELLTPSGKRATEVLVHPRSGAVWLEYGPAMMWNTEYGMPMHRNAASETVSAAEAREIARHWLDEHLSGRTPGDAEAFPGYYTLHTLKDGRITGMLSVNAGTGQVWYHDWHGAFIAMSED